MDAAFYFCNPKFASSNILIKGNIDKLFLKKELKKKINCIKKLFCVILVKGAIKMLAPGAGYDFEALF